MDALSSSVFDGLLTRVALDRTSPKSSTNATLTGPSVTDWTCSANSATFIIPPIKSAYQALETLRLESPRACYALLKLGLWKVRTVHPLAHNGVASIEQPAKF